MFDGIVVQRVRGKVFNTGERDEHIRSLAREPTNRVFQRVADLVSMVNCAIKHHENLARSGKGVHRGKLRKTKHEQ